MDRRLYNKKWLHVAYIKNGRTEQNIADELKCGRVSVNNWLKRFGIPRRRPGIHFRGKPKPPTQRAKISAARKAYWKANPATEEFKQKISTSRRRGGTKRGRPYIRIPGRGYIAEHVYVAEQKIGRRLSPVEQVHHKDGNITNNHPDNLEVLTASEHAKLHSTQRPRNSKGQFS